MKCNATAERCAGRLEQALEPPIYIEASSIRQRRRSGVGFGVVWYGVVVAWCGVVWERSQLDRALPTSKYLGKYLCMYYEH